MKPFNKLIFCLCLLTGAVITAQYTENDWAERDDWMDVARMLDLSGIEQGDTVADIGCHEGYLTMYLAKAVGRQGKVLAEDISNYRLERLQSHAQERGHTNVTTILGNETDPKLPDSTIDIVFVVDAYHEMKKPMTMLRHFRNSLKPGGKIVILEKLKRKVRNKTRKEQATAHSLSPEFVREELEDAGFTILSVHKDLGDWEDNPNKKIWLIVAEFNGV